MGDFVVAEDDYYTYLSAKGGGFLGIRFHVYYRRQVGRTE